MTTAHDTTERRLPDLGVGVGLRAQHYAHVLEQRPAVGFFEILSDNFLDTGGRPLRVLDQVAERYPILMHGVGLDIGGPDPLDVAYVEKLAALRRRSRARVVSDHVCWTSADGLQLHDLLPIPYTEEALAWLAGRVRTVQDILEVPLVLENPSTYVEFTSSMLSEPEFLRALCDATGCRLLVDVNNIYVSCENHGQDAHAYLAEVPWQHVEYFHLAGHTRFDTHLLDTHDAPVCDAVWALYADAHRRSGGRATVIEWDAEIPTFDVLWEQAERALAVREKPGEVLRA